MRSSSRPVKFDVDVAERQKRARDPKRISRTLYVCNCSKCLSPVSALINFVLNFRCRVWLGTQLYNEFERDKYRSCLTLDLIELKESLDGRCERQTPLTPCIFDYANLNVLTSFTPPPTNSISISNPTPTPINKRTTI